MGKHRRWALLCHSFAIRGWLRELRLERLDEAASCQQQTNINLANRFGVDQE